MYSRHYYYVYIMTNRSKTLYTGITSNLSKRVFQHKNGTFPGFTSQYQIDRLVYYERFVHVGDAIKREGSRHLWYQQLFTVEGWVTKPRKTRKTKRGGSRRPFSIQSLSRARAPAPHELRSLTPSGQIFFLLWRQAVDLDAHGFELQFGYPLIELFGDFVDRLFQSLMVLYHVLD
jgi:predicted GIY-YIG superfamily endonuclease